MTTQDAQALGAQIKTAREAAGFSSVRALAKEAGISVAYLAKLEKGEKDNPSPEMLERLAGVLSTTIQELMGFGSVRSKGTLPEPGVYFREKFGVSADDASNMAQWVEEYLSKTNGGVT